MKNAKKAVQVRLDPEDHEKLAHIAEQLGVGVGAALRLVLREFGGKTIEPLPSTTPPEEGGHHVRG